MSALALLAVSELLCGFSQNATMLFVFRGLAGVGLFYDMRVWMPRVCFHADGSATKEDRQILVLVFGTVRARCQSANS
jgi:hypothetical protein